jgi:hypothetical protein
MVPPVEEVQSRRGRTFGTALEHPLEKRRNPAGWVQVLSRRVVLAARAHRRAKMMGGMIGRRIQHSRGVLDRQTVTTYNWDD